MIAALLAQLQALYPVGGLAYLLPDGRVIASPGGGALITALSGTDLVRQTACPGPVDRGSAVVVAGQLVAGAAYPECLGNRSLGVVRPAQPPRHALPGAAPRRRPVAVSRHGGPDRVDGRGWATSRPAPISPG